MKRRNFFKGLMGLGAVAVLPKVELEVQPIRPKQYTWKTLSVEAPPIPKQFYRLYDETEREMALTLSKYPTHLNK